MQSHGSGRHPPAHAAADLEQGASIPQDWGSDGTAIITNANAITDGDGSLGWCFCTIESPWRGGTTSPLPGPSRQGATSSPIPNRRWLSISQPQAFRRLQLLSHLRERLLSPNGHQRLLGDCKSQYYQGCNQLLLITALQNICSAFCH